MSGTNYLNSPYIPVLLSGGGFGVVAPCDICSPQSGHIPVAPRYADVLLNAVVVEMMAGFYQILMPPETETDWAKTWRKPPSSAEIEAAFKPAEKWFNVDGPVPAFQDASLTGEELRPTAKLFHVVPDGQRNTAISVEAAMVALYSMQAHAISGGRGYRTSLSGGGPLRTVPLMGETLFQKVWSLVIPRSAFDRLGKPNTGKTSVYPWQSPPKSTDIIGAGRYPASTLYWSIPRRFLLPPPDSTGVCPITGLNGPLITGVRERYGGPDYPSDQWRHPLTPYARDGKTLSETPIRAESFANGIGWRDRVGMVGESASRRPAEVVTYWKSRCRRLGVNTLRLHAYGARCDKAKMIGILDSVQPYRIAAEEYDGLIEAEMSGAVRAADAVARGLRANLGEALCHQPERSDWSSMEDVLGEGAVGMWNLTESMADQYFDDVSAVISNGEAAREAELLRLRDGFVRGLRGIALDLFDEIVESSARQDPIRVYGRRKNLSGLTYWASVREAIDLPNPKTASPRIGRPTKPAKGDKESPAKRRIKA